ncbi:MAG: FkbM family methyltransferase [Taibaiella sp.]|jgi:FkbM family methyltransferase
MNNSFKKTLESLPRYFFLYGPWEGIKLSLKFLFNRTGVVKIKDAKEKIYLRKNSSDIPTFHQVFASREYGLKMININPKTIIDGGSNIGLFSVFMKNKFPEAQIIAIEPDKENFAMMQKNLKNYKDVSLVNTGIWNKNALLKVYDKFNQGKWGMVVEETNDANDPSAIRSMSIPDIMSQFNLNTIDLLKLDIETAEKYLFDEHCDLWLKKVKTVIIELHDWIEPGTAQPFFNAINRTFNKFSYYIFGEITIIVNEDIQ